MMFETEIGQIGIVELSKPSNTLGFGPSVQTKVDSESTNPKPRQNNHVRNS